MSTSNGSSSRAQLFAKPFVSRFIRESRMPSHEIWKRLDLNRRFNHAYTSYGCGDLCQFSRYGENQVSPCDGKDCRHKEWQSQGNPPLCAKLRQSAIH